MANSSDLTVIAINEITTTRTRCLRVCVKVSCTCFLASRLRFFHLRFPETRTHERWSSKACGVAVLLPDHLSREHPVPVWRRIFLERTSPESHIRVLALAPADDGKNSLSRPLARRFLTSIAQLKLNTRRMRWLAMIYARVVVCAATRTCFGRTAGAIAGVNCR